MARTNVHYERNPKNDKLYKFTKEDVEAIANGTYERNHELSKALTELIKCGCASAGRTLKHLDNDEWVECQSEAYLTMVNKTVPKLLANGDFTNARSFLLCGFIFGFQDAAKKLVKLSKRRKSERLLFGRSLGHFEPPETGMTQGEVLEEAERLYGKRLPSAEQIETMVSKGV